MLNTRLEETERAAAYREGARKLRRLANEIHYDFCRREQLRALAEGFERLADKLEGSPLRQAAD
jgi:hypothetical protein